MAIAFLGSFSLCFGWSVDNNLIDGSPQIVNQACNWSINDSIGNRNAILGALKLSMIADQWGGFTEKVNDGKLKAYLPAPRGLEKAVRRSIWKYWVKGSKDSYLLTDDTSYSLLIGSRFVTYLKEQQLQPSEINFAKFLAYEWNVSNQSSHPYFNKPFNTHYRKHLKSWLKMVNIVLCKEKGKASFCFADINISGFSFFDFYKKNDPRCFGLFLFLPYTHSRNIQEPSLYSSALNFTSLDQGYAAYATACYSQLIFLARKSQTSNTTLDIQSFWEQHLYKKVKMDATNNNDAKKLIEILDLVNKFKFNEDEDFLTLRERVYQWRKEKLSDCVTAFKWNPYEFLAIISLAIRYGGNDIFKTLQFINNMGGDTDTIATIYSHFAGCLIGNKQLFEEKRLRLAWNNIEKSLRKDYDVDFLKISSPYFNFTW